MIVNLKHSTALSREQANACEFDGQKRFHVSYMDTKGNRHFVDIGKHPATYPLNTQVELMPGEYELGCGSGKSRLRRKFFVDIFGGVAYV